MVSSLKGGTGPSVAAAGAGLVSVLFQSEIGPAHGERPRIQPRPAARAVRDQPTEALVAETQESGAQLKRVVGLLDLSALGLGAIITS